MVEIKQSLIADAGLGVFATQDIESNSIITEYYGDVFMGNEIPIDSDRLAMLNYQGFTTVGNRTDYDSKRCGQMINDYALINKYTIIDQQSLDKSILEYQELSSEHANTQGTSKDGKHYISSSRSITQGEELYFHYGTAYWLSVILKDLNKDSKIYDLVSKSLKKLQTDMFLLNEIFAFKRNNRK